MKYISIFILSISILYSINKEDKMNEADLELLGLDKEFAAASLKHGAAEAFRMFMAEDAYQFPGGRDVINGNENIFNQMKVNDSLYTLEWEPQFAQVSSSGDFGWTWGYFKVIPADSSESSFGKYVNVWKRDSDGNWKVAADIGNAGPER